MTMTRHRFYVGLTQQDGNIVTQAQERAMEDALIAQFGAFTRYVAVDARQWQTELARVYEVLTECNGEYLPLVARTLARAANQQCVLYTAETVQGECVAS